MDLSKTGKFIAERRKAQNLTQVQLALKIGVSEKTISKWECGNGFPDSTLMLPLCKALGITANELLSSKLLSNEEYKTTAEENIIKLTKQDLYKNKMLLTLEWIIGYMSVLILLTFVVVASYSNISTFWRTILIVFGLINCIVGVLFTIKIEKDAGYYECGNCHHKYIPTYKQTLWSPHMGRTRHLKCPKCGKKTWSKKTLDNN
ncbi:MAG: helix-turn-helix domain-containing protein [Christensenellales bacterium]